jgi:hypothetical protein
MGRKPRLKPGVSKLRVGGEASFEIGRNGVENCANFVWSASVLASR